VGHFTEMTEFIAAGRIEDVIPVIKAAMGLYGR
jgi:hypothetical protein